MLPVVVVYFGALDPAASFVPVHLGQTAALLVRVPDLVAACLVRALGQPVVRPAGVAVLAAGVFAGAAVLVAPVGVVPQSVPESVVPVAGTLAVLQLNRAV